MASVMASVKDMGECVAVTAVDGCSRRCAGRRVAQWLGTQRAKQRLTWRAEKGWCLRTSLCECGQEVIALGCEAMKFPLHSRIRANGRGRGFGGSGHRGGVCLKGGRGHRGVPRPGGV